MGEIPVAVEAELTRLRAENARLLKLLRLTPQQAAPPGPAQGLVPLTWHSGVLLERDDAYPYAAQSAPPTGSAADAKAFASYIRKTRRPLFRR